MFIEGIMQLSLCPRARARKRSQSRANVRIPWLFLPLVVRSAQDNINLIHLQNGLQTPNSTITLSPVSIACRPLNFLFIPVKTLTYSNLPWTKELR